MHDQHPQVAALDAILNRGRARILQGITAEPQLAEGDRGHARLLVYKALDELFSGLSDWTEQYIAGESMVSGRQADELERP